MITRKHALDDSRAGFDHARDRALWLIGCGSVLRIEHHDDFPASVQEAIVHGARLCPRPAVRDDQDLKRPEVECGPCLVIVVFDEQHDF